ncbi:MAG TPA: helix-turn-helix transcriptional regulator [Bacteroidia bacterium]
MVGNSCIRIVKEELSRTGFIQVHHVELGKAEINFDAQLINLDGINTILKRSGFALIDDKGSQLIEQIKTSVIQLIFYGNNANSLIRNSDFLSERLGHPYAHLSKIFSDKTGTTLEKYIILIKIERIKELISYEEMTLSEISYMMGYSSVQYLSNQFKQITGYSVSEYKSHARSDRKPLSSLIP